MHKKTLYYLSAFFIPLFVNGMERDYVYEGAKLFEGQVPQKYTKKFEYRSDEVCLECFLKNYQLPEALKNVNLKVLPFLSSERLCVACGKQPFYTGYLHFQYRGDYPFLRRHLAFLEKYPGINGYWPETSPKCLEINKLMVSKIEELINSTALSQSSAFRNGFVISSPYLSKMNNEVYARSMIVSCFLFSDYYSIIEEIRKFARTYLFSPSYIVVEEKLGDILEILSEKFSALYLEEQIIYPTMEIAKEIEFIECLKQTWNQDNSSIERDIYFDESNQPPWLLTQYYLAEGELLNDALLYNKAIEVLSKAISYNPQNSEAYAERAIAYFEIGDIDKALEDYRLAKKFKKFNNNSFSLIYQKKKTNINFEKRECSNRLLA